MSNNVKNKTDIDESLFFYDAEIGATVLDSRCYCESPSNGIKVGFSFSYSIRNHTNKPITVISRQGFSQVIEPNVNTVRYQSDETYERNNVWIDIKLRLIDTKKSCYFNPKPTNSIDYIIDKAIYDRVKVDEENVWGQSVSECTFSIALRNIKPNFKSSGFYSETLGIIINIDSTNKYESWLENVIGDFEEKCIDNFGMALDTKTATYQYIYLIDNKNDVNNLWVMHLGEPKEIKVFRNPALDSGLYIFTNTNSQRSPPYDFIPIPEIKDKKLREYGLARSEQELITTCRTKEYVQLMDEKEKLEKQIINLEKQLLSKDEEIKTLKHKGEISEISIRKEELKQQTKIGELGLEVKMLKLGHIIDQKTQESNNPMEDTFDLLKIVKLGVDVIKSIFKFAI